MYPPKGSDFNKQNWWGTAGDVAQWVRGLQHKRNWVQSPEPTEEPGAEASTSNPSSLEGLDRQVLGVHRLVSFPHSESWTCEEPHLRKQGGWKAPEVPLAFTSAWTPPPPRNFGKNTNIYSIAPAKHCLVLAIYVKSLRMFIVLCSFLRKLY